ncbi:thyrotropin-releasing hormone-degrading ectoenzyme-like isoform X2 [Pseudomyrmex gracilis]|uniref:thyrotropin-releasing hormone-degrading ectoenzyme-like isoform X2 n=1 Tax=Pseudomyrmex gracilis TaxID=219809 RepID=UPI000995D9A3|nr:thyrotropin-releasing hormone-degrading ectoenzyme-like isoform X2 [Pseudomyrmex gracilis]
MYKCLSVYFWRSHLVEALDVFSAFRMQSPLVTRRSDARSIVRSCTCLPISMENLRTQEIPDYVSHHKLRVRMVVAIFICVTSLIIILWFVSSFMENKRSGRQEEATGGKFDEISRLQRLSDKILPLEYTLKIVPILEEENFTTIGDVQIQFYCMIPTKHVRFHARNLLIEDLSVKKYSSNSLKLIKKYVATTKDDFIDVFLLQMLVVGQIYVLHIKYTTPLHQKAEGLFRSSYIDSDSEKTRWIAVSNFSPNYARTAYPCFDEPWIKTPFRISIGRKSDMRSHSNSMFRVTEEIHNMPGYVWDHYEKTVPIPTYVVAFMVTDFSGYGVNVDDRPSHTIFSRKEFVNNTKYISYLIPKVLRFIQNFTTFSCKLDKVDVIAVPDLSYSAMENSGLITFREDAIIIKESNDITLPDSKKVVANIAAHEVAHQWFGNLVTPKWWDDVWLKEGFSTFFGYLALNVIEPASWDLQAIFLMDCHDVFNSDADQTAHPLHIDLRKLSGLVDVFDLTSYVKGNCMARMIYHFLGERIFFESVRRYIRTYYYRSADQEDLWSAFQAEIDRRTGGLPVSPRLDMSDVMKTWTYQAGFPVLHVQQNRETGVIELKQDRFYYYGLNSMSKELWHIPLTWTTENEQQFSNTLPKAWMVEKRMKINDIVLNRANFSNQWILFNINQTALYRVNYDAENWKLLTRSFETLPEVAKVQLLTDSSAMVDAGLLDKIIMWRILEKLEAETGEMLWTLAIPLLTTIHDRLWKSSAFEFVMCKFIEKAYNRVAPSLVSKDPILWTGFELRLMKSACLAGNRACLSIIRNFAHKLLRNKTSKSVSEEFRRWTYCIFMKVATDEQWLVLFNRYNESAVNDKESLAFALGCHVNATLLQKYLVMIFSQENVTFAHIERILTSVMLNPHGYNVAKEFLSQYWNKFNTNADNVRNVTLTDTLRVFVKRIRQEEDVEQLRRLIGKSEKYNVEIKQVIYRVQANVAWYKKDKNETQKIVEMISAKLTETNNCKR